MPLRLLATLAAAVAAALAVAVWRSERTGQRARTVLSHAGGLREGSAVPYRGVVVGMVSRMALDTKLRLSGEAHRAARCAKAAGNRIPAHLPG